MYSLVKNSLPFSFQLNKALNKFHHSRTEYSIRPLRITEFKELLETWAVKERWNPGQHEYLPFYKASLNAHKGLFLDKKLVASLSAVRYSKDLAYLGLYIVDPHYRAKGIGQTLVESTLKELTDCALIGINAVQNQTGNYQRKYGFKPSQTNSRYSGYFKLKIDNPESQTTIKIVSSANIDINQLIDYDAAIFSVPRESFLRQWVKMPGAILLAAMQNDKICGYGVISQCLQQGYKLAPLFANDEIIAKKLCHAFAHILKEQAIVQLDSPDNNLSAARLIEQFGFYRTFKTTRMYIGEERLVKDLEDKNNQIYSLTTLEIG